jgi:protein CMS1
MGKDRRQRKSRKSKALQEVAAAEAAAAAAAAGPSIHDNNADQDTIAAFGDEEIVDTSVMPTFAMYESDQEDDSKDQIQEQDTESDELQQESSSRGSKRKASTTSDDINGDNGDNKDGNDDASPQKKKTKVTIQETDEEKAARLERRALKKKASFAKLKQKRKQKFQDSLINVPRLTADEQFDVIQTWLKKYGQELSDVEQDQLSFTSAQIRSFAEHTDEKLALQPGRENFTVQQMPNVIQSSLSKWRNRLMGAKYGPKVKYGHPVVLVVTPSALRAVDIVRALRVLQLDSPIGKLFARHMKTKEQVKFLKKVDVRVAVGTPHRLQQLVDSGALHVTHTRLCIIDAQRNSKKQNIFDSVDITRDFCKFFQGNIQPRLHDTQCKIVLF